MKIVLGLIVAAGTALVSQRVDAATITFDYTGGITSGTQTIGYSPSESNSSPIYTGSRFEYIATFDTSNYDPIFGYTGGSGIFSIGGIAVARFGAGVSGGTIYSDTSVVAATGSRNGTASLGGTVFVDTTITVSALLALPFQNPALLGDQFQSGSFAATGTSAGQYTDSVGVTDGITQTTTLSLKASNLVITTDAVSPVPLPRSAPLFGAAIAVLGALGLGMRHKSRG